MKLYVIVDKKENIVAHSRDEVLVDEYMGSLKKKHNYRVKFLSSKNDKKVEKMIKEFEETHANKTLSFLFSGELSTDDDKKYLCVAEEEYEKLYFMTTDLENIVNNYDLDKDDRKQLKKSLKILNKLKNDKEEFNRSIGYDKVRDIVRHSKINLSNIFNIFGGK